MASVATDKSGRRRILFVADDGSRKTIRLGKVTRKAAESFKGRVEALLAAQATRTSIDADTARWLADLPSGLYGRLVRVGLAKAREAAERLTLGTLLDRFDAAAVKDSTRAAYRQTTASLRAILGERTPLDEIEPADADRWRKTIGEPVKVKADDGTERTKRLASATVAKRVHVARAIFKRAVRWGLIPSSPFADLRAGSQANPERSLYIAPATIAAVLDACPDDEWRAIVALSRFAGLRCPSEIVALRWADVDWERGRSRFDPPRPPGMRGTPCAKCLSPRS